MSDETYEQYKARMQRKFEREHAGLPLEEEAEPPSKSCEMCGGTGVDAYDRFGGTHECASCNGSGKVPA